LSVVHDVLAVDVVAEAVGDTAAVPMNVVP
jgi:hypothetical protein